MTENEDIKRAKDLEWKMNYRLTNSQKKQDELVKKIETFQKELEVEKQNSLEYTDALNMLKKHILTLERLDSASKEEWDGISSIAQKYGIAFEEKKEVVKEETPVLDSQDEQPVEELTEEKDLDETPKALSEEFTKLFDEGEKAIEEILPNKTVEVVPEEKEEVKEEVKEEEPPKEAIRTTTVEGTRFYIKELDGNVKVVMAEFPDGAKKSKTTAPVPDKYRKVNREAHETLARLMGNIYQNNIREVSKIESIEGLKEIEPMPKTFA